MTGTHKGNSAWVRRFHPAPQAPARLICLPHAGGSASYYFPVSDALSPGVDVVAVQYPGRQDRRHEPPVDDLRKLADLVVPEILPLLDRPTILFGHSMGATLGFEIAVRVAAAGVTPHALFVSGRRAPSAFRHECVHLYRDAEFITDLKRLAGTDPQMFEDEQVVHMILPALRSDYRAAETYRWAPTPPLTCPIVALIGDGDPLVTVNEARAWADHTTAEFELGVYPGGHFYLNDHAPAVMTHLTDQFAGRLLRLPIPANYP
jgi:pyochelin biosynthetic protein PchC